MKLLADVARHGGPTKNLKDLRRFVDDTIGDVDVIKTMNRGEQGSLLKICVLHWILIKKKKSHEKSFQTRTTSEWGGKFSSPLAGKPLHKSGPTFLGKMLQLH